MRSLIFILSLLLIALPAHAQQAASPPPLVIPLVEPSPPPTTADFATPPPGSAWPPHASAAAGPPPAKVTVAVMGDSLGDGMWGGLYRLMVRDKRYVFLRGAKNSVGFTGSDLTDMVDAALANGPVDAVVMMIGANDRRSFFVGTQSRALFRSKVWQELYAGRIAGFMDKLQRHKLPTIWILLPVMRADDASADARLINDIVANAARTRPYVKLLPTWPITADEHGAYQAHFKDLKGVTRLMRANDGVHFTDPAYELIGSSVLKLLRENVPPFKILPAKS
ncbi:MAG: DUF459 domain-containing protein [Alphaproteobacteria bacterium]|nr:DUF459 domain-containing protein [Alphaproteobacteria bacterium]MCW5742721.1 DUF459 domain-containing protein [Alphaproteobacteria bacterium]